MRLAWTGPALLALALAACSGRPSSPSEDAYQMMEDFTMSQTRKGETIWELKSPVAGLSLEGRAMLEEPEILFYEGGRRASTVRANTATVDSDTQDLRLEGDVVLVSLAEETTLRTSRLDYSGAEELFRTEEEVFIDRPGAKLKGRGMRADKTLSEISIYHQETVVE